MITELPALRLTWLRTLYLLTMLITAVGMRGAAVTLPRAISAARDYSVALQSDGTVWTWGLNDEDGELGDGTTNSSRWPVQVRELTDMTAIEAGRYHTLGMRTDGTVWAWGRNGSGELGDGTLSSALTAVQLRGLTDVTAIAAGGAHSLAVAGGRVWTWGENSSGQLGDGTTNNRAAPGELSSLREVIAVAGGLEFSVALTAGGVWSWGANSEDGELGNGTTQSSLSPVRVRGLTGARAVAAGYYHSLAISNGAVWAWGYNGYGHLGNGTYQPTLEPVAVTGLSKIVAVAAGAFHSLALGEDGTVWAWGRNTYGQLGDGGDDDRPAPVRVARLQNVRAISAGSYHSLALTRDGVIWAWGLNQHSQLGDDTSQNAYTPVPVDGLTIFPPYTENPLARSGIFRRGDGPYAEDYSTVATLDFQKGIRLDRYGQQSDALYGLGNWPDWFGHYNGADPWLSLPFRGPLVAFGSRGGGTPLYVDQVYTFGAYGGTVSANDSNALAIVVCRKSDLAPLTTNYLAIPQPTDPTAWAGFLRDGYSTELEGFGLTTRLSFASPSDVSWMFGAEGAYRLSHRADVGALNYVYLVALRGKVDRINMVHENGSAMWSPLYVVEFEPRPAWKSVFVGQPHFTGQPMPPEYAGKSAAELLANPPAMPGAIPLAPANCLALDQSPELRRHPILDQFVADQRHDPITLANYVLNEIALCDPMGYPEEGEPDSDGIFPGGVNRGALGVFLEGQGSPLEQCALLIYLLRQAGVPAAYVLPPPDGVFLRREQVSRLLKMRLAGSANGDTAGVPSLIAVHYPWVAAYIGAKWIHLAPWLKDTEIVEGLNVYDYLPPDYDNGTKWVRRYLLGDTNILSLSSEANTPEVLFPRFIEKALRENHPGISIDDLGMRLVDRRNSYSRWTDFPAPLWPASNLNVVAVESLSSPQLAAVRPRWTNLFDTVSVEVYSVSHPARKIITGDLRLADLHNRRFLLRHEKIAGTDSVRHRMILTLAPFRSGVSGTGLFTNDAALLRGQASTNILFANDDALRLRITHKRQRTLRPEFRAALPYHWDLFGGFSAAVEISQERPLRKGDFAAICLHAGRVSTRMLEVHAQDFWAIERLVRQNPQAEIPPQDYEGIAAYLMGMTYYQRMSAFNDWNERVHKVRNLSWYAAGLSKLSPFRVNGILPGGNITLIQPNLDMFFTRVAVAGNGTSRPDSGADPALAARDYSRLLTAEGSAQEHQAIEDFFGQSGAVSTVKLLQLAQRDAASAGPGVLALNRNNYQAYGNSYYHGRALRLHDPALWRDVTNAFAATGSYGTNHGSNFVQVFITPGTNSYNDDSYRGMAAMIFTDDGDSALISGNLHGAVGRHLSEDFFDRGNLENLWLVVDWLDRWKLTFISPNPDAVLFIPQYTENVADLLRYFSEGRVVGSPVDLQAAESIRDLLRLAPPATVSLLVGAAERSGFLGKVWDGLRTLGTAVADPVHAVTGEFYIDAVDLRLAGPMPLELRRNYSSQNLAHNQFGYGWKLNYMHFLSVSADSNVIYAAEADGAVIAYERQGTTDLWLPTARANPQLNNHSHAGTGSTANLFLARLNRIVDAGGELYQLRSPDGSVRMFQVVSFSNSVVRTRPYLTSWKDSRGNRCTFEYGTEPGTTEYGEVRRIQSGNGNFLGLRYDVYGHIIEAYSGDGRRVEYGYDQFGDLTRVIHPDGAECRFEYAHATMTVTNNGIVTNGIYSTHLLVKELKPDGRALMNTYDEQRRVISQQATVGADLELVTNATFIYGNNFDLARTSTNAPSGETIVRDAYGNPTRYQYERGLIVGITDPLGQSIVQDWYGEEDKQLPGYYVRSLKRTVDRRGLETRFRYDDRGNLTNSTVRGDLTGNGRNDEEAVTSSVYNANNLLLETIDPANNRLRYSYLATNPFLPELVVNLAGGTAVRTNRFEYETVRELVTNGTHVITNEAAGLLWREIRACGSPDAATNEWRHYGRGFVTCAIRYTGSGDPAVSNVFAYNHRGELIESRDGAGRRRRWEYDPAGRVKGQEVYEPGEATPLSWEYSYYNANGELTWHDGPRYDPEDYVWRDYDGAGRKIEEIHWRSAGRLDGSGIEARKGDALFASTFNKYDLFGNQTETIDPRGNRVASAYDSLGRLTRQVFYDPTSAAVATNTVAYEPGGKIRHETNPLGAEISRNYTGTGQLRNQQNADGSTNAWRYYLDGRVHRKILSNGSYWETQYDDAARRVVHAFIHDGTVLATTVEEFDRRGNRVRTVDVEGYGTTNRYDGADRLIMTAGPVTVPSEGPPVQQVAFYSYGPGEQLLTVANGLGERTVTVQDALGRPVRHEVRSAGDLPVRVTTTVYAPNHHTQTRWEGTGAGAVPVTTCTDNDGHPLVEVHYPEAESVEYLWFDYDAAGNRIEQRQLSRHLDSVTVWSTNTWSYDARNRPVLEIGPGGGVTAFRYDAAGNLTERLMPGGLKWRAGYTPDGRILSERLSGGDASARSVAYEYFPAGDPDAGLLQQQTQLGRGIVQMYVHDAWRRLNFISTLGATDEENHVRRIEYDRRGYIAWIGDFPWRRDSWIVHVLRRYDGYGQIEREEVLVGDELVSAIDQQWDAAGRRRTLAPAKAMGTFEFDYRADGLLAGAAYRGWNTAFSYGDNGLVVAKGNDERRREIARRDGQGRMLNAVTTARNEPALHEEFGWGEGRLVSYAASRENLTDRRTYRYSPAQRLSDESFIMDGARPQTNHYTFDHGQPGGVGVLTSASVGDTTGSWATPDGGLDDLQRLRREYHGVKPRTASGRALGAGSVNATVNGRPVEVDYQGQDSGGYWRAELPVTAGAQTLEVNAVHPTELFTASATNTFVVTAAPDQVETTYDDRGNLTRRVWRNSAGSLERAQTFLWDCYDRLIGVAMRDTQQDGYDWQAVYDGLGRRLRTIYRQVTNNVAVQLPEAVRVIGSSYDPQIEFLEIGLAVDGKPFWFLYGPDNSGLYGGMQGLGGLEAIFAETTDDERAIPIVNQFGDVQGLLSTDGVSGPHWFTTKLCSYGPIRGGDSIVLGASAHTPASAVAEALQWRGRRIDPTGLYYLGARHYDPMARRFVSADPLGHIGSMDLYSFANGDPVNFFDPDGRLGKTVLRDAGTVFTGVINTTAALVSLPLVALERGVVSILTGGSVGPYLRDYLRQAIQSPVAFYHVTEGASFPSLVAALLHQVPAIGNLVPGPQGNMFGPPVIVISGGIGAENLSWEYRRGERETSNLQVHGVAYPIMLAPYVRGTGTEVAMSMFGGYTARGLEHASQVLGKLPGGSTVYLASHSGAVMRSSISSFYLGFQNIGVARAFAEQGPGIGFFNNIRELHANYSLGRDIISDFGALFSPAFHGAHTRRVWSFSNDRHLQGGDPVRGNEFNAERARVLGAPW